MTILLFAVSVVIIIIAAELFTNAVEWAGYHMGLAQGATGSLLAAIGTALPEVTVPVVALATHSPSADSVAQGAVLGAPFLLLTVGIAVTGLAVAARGGARRLHLDAGQARRDLGVFCVAFAATLVCVIAPTAIRIAVGVLLLAAYGAYAVATLRGGPPVEEMPEPLHIVRWRPGRPHPTLIAMQLIAAAALLVLGSALFVNALDRTAEALRIGPLVLALIVVPLATELPETLNSVLWVRSRDDTLAFGNVAGSTTFQACILGFIGLVFTSWKPGAGGIISGGLTLLTAVFLLWIVRRGRPSASLLLAAVVPWAGYVVAQVVTSGRLGG